MFHPQLEEVLHLSHDYNLIPIRYAFLADTLTPISLYRKVRGKNTYLLESVEGGDRWARYSFIGLDPFLIFEGKDQTVRLTWRDGQIETRQGNPLDELQAFMGRYRSPSYTDFPRFTGGAVGFFGYELLHYFEDLPPHRENDLQMNDVHFLFSDQVIVFDHLKQEVQFIAHLYVEDGDDEQTIRRKYEETTQRIRESIERIHRTDVSPDPVSPFVPKEEADTEELPVRSNMRKEEYEAIVEKAKAYIAAGDIFQTVLSQRFEVETEADPFDVYRVLRTLNPSPYMYILEFDEETIVGTSPELLVRVEQGKVENRPIAGTRKRGRTDEEDRRLEDELVSDEKERAEHHMLLDLGRNDVGRVSKYGSVSVDQFMDVEYYSHVMHLVSHVTGMLSEDKTAFDALVSCFPAGTVSGAPKLRAMEIIAELEKNARNAYAGAIGYLSFSGNMDTCITIRTMLFKQMKAYVQAGGGIVADSDPEEEYEESVNKARALLRALRAAELMAEGVDETKEANDHVETGIK